MNLTEIKAIRFAHSVEYFSIFRALKKKPKMIYKSGARERREEENFEFCAANQEIIAHIREKHFFGKFLTYRFRLLCCYLRIQLCADKTIKNELNMGQSSRLHKLFSNIFQKIRTTDLFSLIDVQQFNSLIGEPTEVSHLNNLASDFGATDS